MITNIEYVIHRGMDCLLKTLGPIETAEFIMNIKTDSFDYAKWRKHFFDNMAEGEFHEEAIAYAKAHPYKGNAKIIID
ncbi:MAG: hypothetical protein J6O04_01875 [Selenomonadaceae bacterium]|nr:hypothetical protein [Selenomonadaceae bacterium]